MAISSWEAAMARGPKPAPVTLSLEECAALEALVRRRSAGQALVQRARIVLACGRGLSNTQVANDLKVTKPTVGNGEKDSLRIASTD